MRLDPETNEPAGAIDYFLQCRFDGAGLLTWCLSRGYTPLVEGERVCGRKEDVETASRVTRPLRRRS